MKKNLLTKIADLIFSTEELKFENVKTTAGIILKADMIEVDQKVVEVNESGEIDVPDGTYTLEDGRELVIVGSIITDIIEASEEGTEPSETEDANGVEPVETKMETVQVKTKDGVELTITGGGDSEDIDLVGASVVDVDGNPVSAGDYELESGITITVDENGIITSFVQATDGVVENDFSKQVTKLEEEFATFKSEFIKIQNENVELKKMVETFQAEASATPTETVKFEFDKENKKPKSPLHQALGL